MPFSNRKVGLLFCFLWTQLMLYGQDILEQNLESSQEVVENENINLEYQYENLETLIQHPLNLNKASLHDLTISGLFTSIQINALLSHIENNGKLISLYELQAIPNFSLEYIYSILPYVRIQGDLADYHLKFNKLISKGDYQIFLRYQQSFPNKIAYQNNNYLGSPSKLYWRYKYTYSNKFYYGLTAEKDQGEPMFQSKNKLGFDFYSFHVFWRKSKKISAIAIGDYQVNLGQGLILWTGFGFNKSIAVSSVKKDGEILKPFTSVNEFQFLRGLAFSYNFKKFQLTPFLSYKALDASLQYEDSLSSTFSSNRIRESGYHRTATELQAKNAVHELKTGYNFQYKDKKQHYGINLVYSNYSKALKFPIKPYNQFQFQGKNHLQLSADYHYIHKSFHFFGENALSYAPQQTGFALLNGVLLNPSKRVDLSIVYRHYSKKYQDGMYTNAFGESSSPSNEKGLFLGIKTYPFKHISIAAYIDYYQFQMVNYTVKKPSQGYDLQFQIRYKPSKKFYCYLNYKREVKEANTKISLGTNDEIAITKENYPYFQAYFQDILSNDDLEIGSSLRSSSALSKTAIEKAVLITPQSLQKIRLHVSYQAHKSWLFQTRFEYSLFEDKIHPGQHGFLLYQDIQYKSIKNPFGFSTRVSFFDISQYNARIYAYENDVLHQFSVPAIYDAGIRFYLNMQYKISKNIQVWLRFSHTNYNDVRSKGSGNDQIMSNKIYDLKMQIRWKF